MLAPPLSRIAIYADRKSHASSAPLEREVERAAPDLTVERIEDHRALWKKEFYRNLHLLIVPGIEGEESLYHDHIGPANDLIRDWIAAGGTYMGQCAGAYYAAREARFRPGWGQARERDKGLLGLYNGMAYGPPEGLGDGGYLTSTAIIVGAKNGAMRAFPIAYSSGPTFIPFSNTQSPRVIARYGNTQGMPPAIIAFPYGQGLVILSGPVPQYGRHGTIGELSQTLAPYEHDRAALMRMLLSHANGQKMRPR